MVKRVTTALLVLGLATFSIAADGLEDSRNDEQRLAALSHDLEILGPAVVLEALRDETGLVETDPRWANLRGLARALLGDHRAAVADFEAGLRLDPGLAEIHFNLAVSLSAQGITGRALSEFEQTLEIDPEHLEARIGLTHELLRLRRFAPAAEHLKWLGRRAEQDARVLRLLARQAEAEGESGRALELWTRLEALEPTAELARRRAEILRGSDPSAAAAAYDTCARRDPAAVDCREAAASLLLAVGDAAGAVARLSDDPVALGEEGLRNLLLGLYELGSDLELEAVVARRSPQDAAAWGTVALSRRRLGALESAERAVRAGLDVDPLSAPLWNLLGVLLSERGDPTAARAAWERALEIDPDDASSRANLDARGR